jgi:biopolymer transport protein TolR
MALHLGGKKAVSDINVTPLVDIVLVLLIVFMVMTPLAEKQMYLRVPETSTDVPVEQSPTNQTVLLVKADGRLLLNREEVSIESAMTTVRAMFEGRPSKVLFLGAEDGVRYHVVVRVADELRKSGVNTIAMLTEQPSDAPGSAAATPTP